MNNRAGPRAIDLDHGAIGDLKPTETANEPPMRHHHQTFPIGAWLCFFEKSTGAGGDHGYDPADANMAALFIANGPDIEPGTDLGTFDNTSVYPLLAKLTGVEPVQGDGDIADVEAALR